MNVLCSSYLQAGVDTALLLIEMLVALDEVEVTLDLLLARLLLATRTKTRRELGIMKHKVTHCSVRPHPVVSALLVSL